MVKKRLLKKKLLKKNTIVPFTKEWGLQVAPQMFDDALNTKSVTYKGNKNDRIKG